ncbi:phosphotransferase family enzyme [Promicromonospora sp. AC04]|uniref:aminoglycoside phosphotransferase family protein n=1 Tax=Promicromonospora sp. AC04 TaxID=2135723 RepID=UPI000D33F217|nr:aminoglycoside phosphotransferase family protein [Promicromonospora sp. AC04]PUB32582.1 phosphotransferase family enzyme [Promicromonospora sp. AC04]
MLKFTNNAVFALDNYGIIVRIAGSEPVSAKARRGVDMARWLAEHGIPAVRLVEDFEQPIHVDGLAVTTWHQVPDEGAPVRPEDLGLLLRRLHAITEEATDLPRWDQLASIRARLAAATTLTTEEHVFLAEVADELEEELIGLEPLLQPGPLHGDAHTGNVIPGPDGPVLCDFDSAANGPREWDLTPIAVGHLRLTPPPDAYPRFVQAYGVDLTKWTGFPILRRLRELQLVTSALPVLAANPGLWPQWRLRFETLRAGDTTTRWKRNG